MTMQQTPLLLPRILGRGAKLDPNEEVVTLREDGTHRQTLKTTWERQDLCSPLEGIRPIAPRV